MTTLHTCKLLINTYKFLNTLLELILGSSVTQLQAPSHLSWECRFPCFHTHFQLETWVLRLCEYPLCSLQPINAHMRRKAPLELTHTHPQRRSSVLHTKLLALAVSRQGSCSDSGRGCKVTSGTIKPGCQKWACKHSQRICSPLHICLLQEDFALLGRKKVNILIFLAFWGGEKTCA